jgi:hypothetical protein
MKKQRLKEQLYHLHFTCAADWQGLWPLITGNIDKKRQKQTQQKTILAHSFICLFASFKNGLGTPGQK